MLPILAEDHLLRSCRKESRIDALWPVRLDRNYANLAGLSGLEKAAIAPSLATRVRSSGVLAKVARDLPGSASVPILMELRDYGRLGV